MAVESPYGSQRGLVIRQFANPTPSRTVGAVWRKSSTREAAIGAVCDVMASVMAKGNGTPRTAVAAKKGRELTRNS
jgi:LysR family transcriptional regulator, hydrogen peroxide-inducible genes activator